MEQNSVVCFLKKIRTRKGMTQIQLAKKVGIKRQAVYDIETGRYLPNTGVALKLARTLGCRVEDLFHERSPQDQSATVVSHICVPPGTRVKLAKIKDRLIAYPMENQIPSSNGIHSANGVLGPCGTKVKLLHDDAYLKNTGVLMGCDPAFGILGGHMSHIPGSSRLHWMFASSFRSLECLGACHTHMAGIHLHNTGSDDSNADLARTMLAGRRGSLIAFAFFEEGLMVARGNPKTIKGVDDLTRDKVRLINREPGAALRGLLDDCLKKEGVAPAEVNGYKDLVRSHSQGACRVQFGMADAALGLRAVAASFELDFVPITTVRSDLVIPKDSLTHPAIQVALDILQTREFREELAGIPGYDSGCTGQKIADL